MWYRPIGQYAFPTKGTLAEACIRTYCRNDYPTFAQQVRTPLWVSCSLQSMIRRGDIMVLALNDSYRFNIPNGHSCFLRENGAIVVSVYFPFRGGSMFYCLSCYVASTRMTSSSLDATLTRLCS